MQNVHASYTVVDGRLRKTSESVARAHVTTMKVACEHEHNSNERACAKTYRCAFIEVFKLGEVDPAGDQLFLRDG